MSTSAWLLIFVSQLGIATLECPSTIKCFTSDNRDTCREQGLYFQNNAQFGGCCPGCKAMPEVGEDCDDKDNPCAPGLLCSRTNICAVNPNSGCEKKRRDMELKNSVWTPDCLPDDTFAPKQCKGESLSGRCFCFSADGDRVFGEEAWEKAENMTCGCSRLMWETLKLQPDASYHCTSQGNFEGLQCNDGVCWCARENNGEPYSLIVPDKMMKALPCYNADTHGDQYLRNCESQRVAATHLKKLLTIHGTENINFPPISCNYDGSFARVQIKDGMQICTAKNGSPITEYPTELSIITDCNCAYDKFVSDEKFEKVCDQSGAYRIQQFAADKNYCVDSDGFYIDCELTLTH